MPLLTQLIEEPDLFDLLCNDRTPAGKPFADAVAHHSNAITDAYLAKKYGYYKDKMVGVIGIPRGGIPTALAVHNALAENETGDILYIESRLKTTEEPLELLGRGLMTTKPESVYITDGVIASGASITKHFSAIAAANPEEVIVISNCTTEIGMDHIAEQARVHGINNLEQVTGRIFGENECQWMDIDGKKVLFVGFNKDAGLDLKLPDFGDYIQYQKPARM